MRQPVVAIDGVPLIEKVCGVRNFSESLIITLAEEFPQLPIVIIIPKLFFFENQFHYENIQILQSMFSKYKNVSIELHPGNYLLFACTYYILKFLQIHKTKTFARYIWHVAGLRPILKKLLPDYILYTTQELGKKVNNIPNICVVHDMFGFQHYQIQSRYNYFHKLFYQLFYTRTYVTNIKNSDLILTVSNQVKIDLYLLYGIPLKKVITLYEGAGREFVEFQPQKEKLEIIRKKYNLPKRYLLSSNPESYRKSPLHLVEALKELREKNIDISIVFFGTGQDNSLNHIIQQLNLHNYVHFILEIEKEDLPYIYSLSNCFIFNTLSEGFGLPALEAIYCKTPVIAYAIGTLLEVYQNALLFVDPFDTKDLTLHVSKIIQDKSFAETLVKEQMRITNKFKWKNIIKEFEVIFRLQTS